MGSIVKRRKRCREDERNEDEWGRKLLEASPYLGLLSLLTGNWKNGTFQSALKSITRPNRIPQDIVNPRKQVPTAASNETDDIRKAWIAVVCAQATHYRNIIPKLGEPPNWEMLGFDRDQFKSDEEFASFLKKVPPSKDLYGNSKGGKIDPYYDWLSDVHEKPALARAFGMSPMGLGEMCDRLDIGIKKAKIRLRASTITWQGAMRLLDKQLSKRINRSGDASGDPSMAARIWNSVSKQDQGTGQFKKLKEVLMNHGVSIPVPPSANAKNTTNPVSPW